MAASDMPIIQVKNREGRTRRAPETEFSPQRIHVVFHSSLSSAGVLNSTFRARDGPFQRALQILSNGLAVRPIQGDITIPPTCTNITEGPNAGKCRNGTLQNTCGIFTVPPELAGVREACEGPEGACFEHGTSGDGVAADYILFAGALNSEKERQYHMHVVLYNFCFFPNSWCVLVIRKCVSFCLIL